MGRGYRQMDTVQCIDGNLRQKDIRHMDTADLRSWQIDDASYGWLLKIGGRCRQSDTLDRYVCTSMYSRRKDMQVNRYYRYMDTEQYIYTKTFW